MSRISDNYRQVSTYLRPDVVKRIRAVLRSADRYRPRMPGWTIAAWVREAVELHLAGYEEAIAEEERDEDR